MPIERSDWQRERNMEERYVGRENILAIMSLVRSMVDIRQKTRHFIRSINDTAAREVAIFVLRRD